MADSKSTDGVLKIIRTRILTFVPNQNLSGGDTRTLSQLLGTYIAGGVAIDRLWFETAPDDVDEQDGVNLWGLMQIIPAKQAGDDGGFMLHGMLEVQLFCRPRRGASQLAIMADVVQEALKGWLYTDNNTYIMMKGGLVRTKIQYQSPADRELYQINLRNDLSYMPEFITQYSST